MIDIVLFNSTPRTFHFIDYLRAKVHTKDFLIMKGGGIWPYEALATIRQLAERCQIQLRRDGGR